MPVNPTPGRANQRPPHPPPTTTTHHPHHPHPPRHRGAAMAETLLVLPLVMAVLSLLLFVGWGMRRLQHASVVDRYEAWREVSQAPGPSAGATDTRELNATFFAGHAQRMRIRRLGDDPTGARQSLIDAAQARSPAAGALAQAAISAWPASLSVGFDTTQNSRIPFWQPLAGPIRHHYVRLGNEWKYVNRLHLSPEDGKWHPMAWPVLGLAPHVRQQFFPSLDARLQALAQQGDWPAATLRACYALKLPYHGPSLPSTWHVGGGG